MPVRRLDEQGVSAPLGAGPVSTALVRILGPLGTKFNVGDLVTMSATFADPTSIALPLDPPTGYGLVQPVSVLCLVRGPGAMPDVTPVASVNVTTMVYTATFAPQQSGVYWFRFYSPAGPLQGVGEGVFHVRRQRT